MVLNVEYVTYTLDRVKPTFAKKDNIDEALLRRAFDSPETLTEDEHDKVDEMIDTIIDVVNKGVKDKNTYISKISLVREDLLYDDTKW